MHPDTRNNVKAFEILVCVLWIWGIAAPKTCLACCPNFTTESAFDSSRSTLSKIVRFGCIIFHTWEDLVLGYILGIEPLLFLQFETQINSLDHIFHCKMATMNGPPIMMTEGSDFLHRQRLARQYQIRWGLYAALISNHSPHLPLYVWLPAHVLCFICFVK